MRKATTARIRRLYQLGERWHVVESSVGVFQTLVVAAAVVAVVWFVLVKVRRRSDGEKVN